ncbi:MAG TPA: SusD/RagB family nutrient-binding outer membrane lipoprotein [Chitinophaga sp.]|uniref:SusD/RagB family nutrient-binding outer membrane lipoprotein n=1 Tax=Chitinophaga sp. TaxID=1869181 RepID=UPI002F95DF4A
MLTRYLKYSCYLLLSCLAIAGCKKLEDINHDPTKPTTTQPQYLLTGAEKSAMDILYAGPQNGRIGMPYAQYWTGNDKANDSRYLLDEGINGGLWDNLYGVSLHNLDQIIQMNRATPIANSKNQIAIAQILKAWIIQFLSDAYGNVPYTQAFKLNENNLRPAYDDAKTIYRSLIDTLATQAAGMDPSLASFDAGDVLYNGNVAAWQKLAYSLILRLGIRMADADPATAKTVIEANFAKAMTSNADNAQFQYLGIAPNKFPYNESERPLSEFFVTATLVDYMQSLTDPRLGIYARKAADSVYRGLAYGTSETNPNRLPPANYSYPGKRIYAADMAGILMTYPEVEFILAEAAARGMSTGDAATHYQNGVKASMEYWGITNADSVAAYLTRVPYVAGDWRNVIGSQKWLALYPQGFQGWFERTRLNFQKPGGDSLFRAPADGSLDPNVSYVPYRLTYLVSEQQQNKAAYDAAASAIGGDTKKTKLWWNKQ